MIDEIKIKAFVIGEGRTFFESHITKELKNCQLGEFELYEGRQIEYYYKDNEVSITKSIPKAIYGENYTHLTMKDFLQFVTDLETATHTHRSAWRVYALAFGVNVSLSVDVSAVMAECGELKNYYRSSIKEATSRGAKSIYYLQADTKVILYDKVAEMRKRPTPQAQEIIKHHKRHDVLRIEYKILRRCKIKQLFGRNLYVEDLADVEKWSKSIDLLCKTFNDIDKTQTLIDDTMNKEESAFVYDTIQKVAPQARFTQIGGYFILQCAGRVMFDYALRSADYKTRKVYREQVEEIHKAMHDQLKGGQYCKEVTKVLELIKRDMELLKQRQYEARARESQERAQERHG